MNEDNTLDLSSSFCWHISLEKDQKENSQK
jgi:hypothetical protein